MIYGRELPGYPYNFKAKLTRCLVVGRRIVYGKWLARFSNHAPLSVCAQGQAANDLIRSMIEAQGPCLIARYGCGELEATLRGIDEVDADGHWHRWPILVGQFYSWRRGMGGRLLS